MILRLLLAVIIIVFYYYQKFLFIKKNKIIKYFCNRKSKQLINIILLIGKNKKLINKYIKIIAILYNKQIFKCDLHKLYNTNDIKELFFHKNIINFNNKFYCININKRIYVFNHNTFKDYNEYINELTNILFLLNDFNKNKKLILIFIINNYNHNHYNHIYKFNYIDNFINNLQIYINKYHYNCIKYNYKNKVKCFYY